MPCRPKGEEIDKGPGNLADEPAGDLDAASAKDVLTILSRLNQQHEKTVIMLTHDIVTHDVVTHDIVTHDHGAAKYARRVLYLEKAACPVRGGCRRPNHVLCSCAR